MSVTIELVNASGERGLPLKRQFAEWAQAALVGAGLEKDKRALSIRLVGEEESAQLNGDYRSKGYATNVLSFPLPAGFQAAGQLGDLALCAAVVKREANEQQKAPQDHWAHLVVHGVLHLLGYDHEQTKDAKVMEALEVRIRTEAKSIAESYLAPPHTTDFAILFLPIEGLYAEVLRRPGLVDSLQRDYRVTLAGPTTLLAMLNSLHMGFRTLALEQQASEVWKVLGAVKTEFERYGDWVEKVREQVQKAADTLDKADTRSRQMRRALKNVEALPEGESQKFLPLVDEPLDDTDSSDTTL